VMLGYMVRYHRGGAEALRHSVVKLDHAVSARASDVVNTTINIATSCVR
jgi:hypothetical protein